MVKAFLFDFDGVLADTEPYHWRAWLQVLTPYGPRLDWETYRRVCIGVADVEMRNEFSSLCDKPVTSDEIKGLYPQKREHFNVITRDAEVIQRRLVDVLSGLRNVKLAVVTSSNQAEVEPILRTAGLLNLLTTAVYGNDVTHYKPHPEPYLLALDRLGVDPADAVVFEDSQSGIRSATAAGCEVVEVKDPDELPDLVSAIRDRFA